MKRSIELCGDCMHLGVAERLERVSALDQGRGEQHLVCRLNYQGLTFVGRSIDWAKKQPWYGGARDEFEGMTVPGSCGREAYETAERLREL